MPKTTITDVTAIGINVRDQDVALAFFVDTLGFEKRLDAPISDTMRWITVAPPEATTSIALIGGETSGVDTGIRFAVPDAAAEHAALRDRGVTVSDLIQWVGVPPMFTFEDPDGNRFYIVEETVQDVPASR